MTSLGDVSLRFASDDDMLSWESKLDIGNGNGIWPRTDKAGNKIRDWNRYHQRAMNELARRLRSAKDTAEPFELGRIGMRSRAFLRDPAACLALHFLFVDAQQSDDPFLSGKAEYYWRMAGNMIDAETEQLDYDADNNGTIDDIEKNQPFSPRVIRG